MLSLLINLFHSFYIPSSSSGELTVSPHHLHGNSPCPSHGPLSWMIQNCFLITGLPGVALFPDSLFSLQQWEWPSPCLRGASWVPSHWDLSQKGSGKALRPYLSDPGLALWPVAYQCPPLCSFCCRHPSLLVLEHTQAWSCFWAFVLLFPSAGNAARGFPHADRSLVHRHLLKDVFLDHSF